MSRLKQGGAIVALIVAVIGGHEGLRLNAYRDIVNVPTICYGETKGVRMGDRHTKAECDAMLLRRLDEFANHVEACVTRKMPDKVEVAFTSLAYNIGWAGFCKSSVARNWNEGREVAACDALMKFNQAGGRAGAGLTRRRADERKLCLEGLG